MVRGRHAAYLGLLLVFLPSVLWAEHISWMQGYQDAEGISCCARTDCRPKDITVLNHTRGDVLIDGASLTIPSQSIHRIPPEAHEPAAVSGFWCFKGDPLQVTAANTRCVFFRTPLW